MDTPNYDWRERSLERRCRVPRTFDGLRHGRQLSQTGRPDPLTMIVGTLMGHTSDELPFDSGGDLVSYPG